MYSFHQQVDFEFDAFSSQLLFASTQFFLNINLSSPYTINIHSESRVVSKSIKPFKNKKSDAYVYLSGRSEEGRSNSRPPDGATEEKYEHAALASGNARQYYKTTRNSRQVHGSTLKRWLLFNVKGILIILLSSISNTLLNDMGLRRKYATPVDFNGLGGANEGHQYVRKIQMP